MHDMLRDICIRKSAQHMFLKTRRMSFHTSEEMEGVNDSTESMPLTRSVICTGDWSVEFPCGAFSAARLLRVLDFMDMRLYVFPIGILEFVNLHFLSVECYTDIPRGISRLWNLQTLIAPNCQFGVPSELWHLSELRNLEVSEFELLKDEEVNYSVLKKLRRISVDLIKEEATTWDCFLKSIPNIKELSINDRHQTTSTTIDLSHLHKLEILTCDLMRSISSPNSFGCRFRVIFPCNIRNLVLFRCEINLGAWGTVCALHKLEVLSINFCTFKREKATKGDEYESGEETSGEESEATKGDEFESGEETSVEEWELGDGDEPESDEETCEDEEWELGDGDVFLSLQFLYLKDLCFDRWIADETNFPRLRQLSVYGCQYLEEIPSSIGEIPTLKLIELRYCSESAVASAERIVEEQSENGNYDLKLNIVKDD